MKRYRYAVVDDNAICLGIVDSHQEIKKQNYIETEVLENTLVGKKRVGKRWVEVEKVEEEISEEKALQIIEESQAKIRELESTIIELSGKVDFQKRAK